MSHDRSTDRLSMVACRRFTRKEFAGILLLAGLMLFATGCGLHLRSPAFAPLAGHAIPARLLPDNLRGGERDAMVPLDYRHLQQQAPEEHVIGVGDVLGIYVRDVIGRQDLAAVHYPNQGQELLENPSVGQPIRVQSNGTIRLPDTDPIPVVGLSLSDAAFQIERRYVDDAVLKPGKAYVSVDLIRSRTVKVTVLREDMDLAVPIIKTRDSQLLGQHGKAHVIELPVFENDVLHALTATGGLPGHDAYNAVWILRGSTMSCLSCEQFVEQIENQQAATATNGSPFDAQRLIQIPLRTFDGQLPPIDPGDIVLEDGDILFIESREREYFVTGGLLTGGMFALPRDFDLDIFSAIAMAAGNAIGPAGINAAASNFAAGPGNIVPPTRVIIIRSLPDGQQVKIHVDLRIAADNPRERITIQPRDVVLLKYRPSEIAANLALNLVNFNFFIPNGQ